MPVSCGPASLLVPQQVLRRQKPFSLITRTAASWLLPLSATELRVQHALQGTGITSDRKE